MSKEQFKRLKKISLKGTLPVKFEFRKGMTQQQLKDEKEVGEALNNIGLIYDSLKEVKEEDLRVEGKSE